jgi:hypothetical protein
VGEREFACIGLDNPKNPYNVGSVLRAADARSFAPSWEIVRPGLALGGEAKGPLSGGDPVFCVSAKGREVALAGITFKRTWGYGTPTNVAAEKGGAT